MVQIPREEIDRVASVAFDLLRPLEHQSTRDDVYHTLELAKLGLVQLWFIKRLGERARACIVTEIADHSKIRICTILMCAGEGMWEWKHLIKTIEEFAAQELCDQVEIPGREGWGRVFKDYEKAYSVFVKEI
jgi:hypothetical protein